MTPDPDPVLDLIARWSRPDQANDPGALGPQLADGFVGVDPLGYVLDRDQWLHRFIGGLHNRNLTLNEPEPHHHGTAAGAVGILEQQTSYQGRDSSGRFRLPLTAVPVDADWRLAAVHLGPLPQPSSAVTGTRARR